MASKDISMRSPFNNSSMRGFTILELLVVISIIAILSSVVIVSSVEYRYRGILARAYEFSAQFNRIYGAGLAGEWRFNEGSGTATADSSGNNLNGVLLNNAVWTSPSFDSSNAIVFGGTANSAVVVADSPLLDVQRFAVSLWFKPTADITAASGQKDILSKLDSYWIVINHAISDGKIGVFLNNDSSTIRRTTTNVWKAGRWYHLAVTYDEGRISLYVNGLLETSDDIPGDPIPQNSTGALGIGGDVWAGFPGTIDEVRIFNLDNSVVFETSTSGATNIARSEF